MSTPRSGVKWEVNAHHPDRTEPYDFFCRFYSSEVEARGRMAALEEEGWEHINLVPPAAHSSRNPTR